MSNALERAVAVLGSQSAFARFIGVSQPSVWAWLDQCKPLPAEHVLKVESRTGISRHELRPDLYPTEGDGPVHGLQPAAEWPIQSANNGAEIIRPDEEAGPGHPFSVTCSRTSTRPQVDARADQLGSNTPASSPGASAMPPADAA